MYFDENVIWRLDLRHGQLEDLVVVWFAVPVANKCSHCCPAFARLRRPFLNKMYPPFLKRRMLSGEKIEEGIPVCSIFNHEIQLQVGDARPHIASERHCS